jgi:hypothetical protein
MTKVSKEHVSRSDWGNVNGWNIFYEKKAAFSLALYDFTGLCHFETITAGEKTRVNGGLQLSVFETLALLFSLGCVVQGWLLLLRLRL